MKFKLLGQLEIVTDLGRSFFLSKSKISQILCLLLIANGDMVSVDTLIEELWGENAPRSALTTLQTYIYHARKMFAAMPEGQNILITRPSGYAIQTEEDAVDVIQFERLTREARTLLEGGRPELAVEKVGEALKLWRGPALSGMMVGPVLNAHVTFINELRFAAIELRSEASQQLGRHHELIPQLRLLVAEHPLNESLHAQLITALHKCGRRAEALQAYRNLCKILDSELGVDPAPELQQLQSELLARANAPRYPRQRFSQDRRSVAFHTRR